MPIRFRCTLCHGLLSIATRKAGTEVDCPKCGRIVLVPNQDDLSPPKPEINGATELDLAPIRSPDPGEKEQPRVHPRLAPSPVSAPARGAAPAPVPASTRKRTPGSEPPLFEHSDFDRYLDPAVKKAAELAAKNNVPKPVQSDSPPALPNDGGFHLTRGSVVVLGIMMLFLLVMAFATGYVMGS